MKIFLLKVWLNEENQARLNSWAWRIYLMYLTVAVIFSVCDHINFRANECRAKLVWAMPSAAENHEINRIGNMPTFSISENNESLLSDCRAKNFRANECRAKLVWAMLSAAENHLWVKCMPIVNKQVKFLTAFPSSQMSRAKLALTMSWRGNVSNSIYRHL